MRAIVVLVGIVLSGCTLPQGQPFDLEKEAAKACEIVLWLGLDAPRCNSK